MPLALSDNHLRIVLAAAGLLPVGARRGFLQRVAAQLRDTDGDLGRAVQAAMRDLIQSAA
jgi:hypothetical protein